MVKKAAFILGVVLATGLFISCTSSKIERPASSSVPASSSQVSSLKIEEDFSDFSSANSEQEESAWMIYQPYQLSELPKGPYTPVGEDYLEVLKGEWFFAPQLFEGGNGDGRNGYSFSFGESAPNEMTFRIAGYEMGSTYIMATFEKVGDGVFKATPTEEGREGGGEAIDAFDFTFKIETSPNAKDNLLITILTFEYDGVVGVNENLVGKTYPFFNYSQVQQA